MQLKLALFALIISAVYLHQTEAAPKLGLIKAKVALVKAPHIIAKVAVAKEVKAKTKIAVAKSFAAAKATKLAALSAITAPFRVAKKTIALKVGAVKAAKAVKIAKVAKAAYILKQLKKSPIILPVQVAAVPLKPFPLKSLPAPNLFNIPAPSLADALGPIRGFVANAQQVIHSATSGNPLTLTISNKAPDNRFFFCAEVEITNNNEVSYHPQVNSEGQL